MDDGVIASILKHKTRVNVHIIGGKLELETKNFAFSRRESECVEFVSVCTKFRSFLASTKTALVPTRTAFFSIRTAIVSGNAALVGVKNGFFLN